MTKAAVLVLRGVYDAELTLDNEGILKLEDI